MQPAALIYCRVSSDRQAKEGHGLDSQEHRCREYARTNGYEVEAVFRDSFSGGGDFMLRPAMQKLLAYADEHPHKNYAVIFDDLSRFARDIKFHFELKQAFKARDLIPLCLNFNFEDTPEGELVEGVIALQNQYHRKSNRRQVIQKQKARLEKGYWPFYPPPGYEQVRDPVHGKLLKPVEPIASLIRQAFEGYGSGRFESLSDVMRFLRDASYGNIYVEGVRRLLRRVVYAGYVERREWDVSRRKGQHEAIVSMQIYEQVQARLDGFYKTRVRKTDNPDFALRGFVLCCFCNKPMTASWVRGRTDKYRYYRCNTRTCVRYNKSVRGDLIEKRFIELLRLVSPREPAINLASAVLLDLWEGRVKIIDDQRRRLQDVLKRLRKDVDSLTELITKATSDRVRQVYEQKIEAIEQERLTTEEKLIGMGASAVGFETALETVLNFLKDPFVIWETGDLNAKRSVLRLIFADKLAFHPEMGFETAQKSALVAIFEQLPAKKSQDVEVGGIEPPCKEKQHAWSTSVEHLEI